MDTRAVESYFRQLQNNICRSLIAADKGVQLSRDVNTYATGGEGVACVIENGEIFEKAGVNFSFIEGPALPQAATSRRPELAGCQFRAMGVSLVIHPNNPYVPTSHANVRLFVAEHKDRKPVWWFGGGYDLTPFYPFEEDCIHWHTVAHQTCQPFGDDVYPRFKQWCDDYFHLKHRKESRGIGGLFFDDLSEWSFDRTFEFVGAVGDSFLPAYLPIVERRSATPWGEREKSFQQYRRGRYVEFNLLQDRGTIFGLQSGGRTESILMSMPPTVKWRYNWQPEPETAEAALYEHYLIPRDWINPPASKNSRQSTSGTDQKSSSALID